MSNTKNIASALQAIKERRQITGADWAPGKLHNTYLAEYLPKLAEEGIAVQSPEYIAVTDERKFATLAGKLALPSFLKTEAVSFQLLVEAAEAEMKEEHYALLRIDLPQELGVLALTIPRQVEVSQTLNYTTLGGYWIASEDTAITVSLQVGKGGRYFDFSAEYTADESQLGLSFKKLTELFVQQDKLQLPTSFSGNKGKSWQEDITFHKLSFGWTPKGINSFGLGVGLARRFTLFEQENFLGDWKLELEKPQIEWENGGLSNTGKRYLDFAAKGVLYLNDAGFEVTYIHPKLVGQRYSDEDIYLRAALQETNQIKLASVLEKFGLESAKLPGNLSQLVIQQLLLEILPNSKSYSFLIEIEENAMQAHSFDHNAKFRLKQLGIKIHKDKEGFSGEVQGFFYLNGTAFRVEAAKAADSWHFIGECSEDALAVGKLVTDLTVHFELGQQQIPKALQSLEVSELYVYLMKGQNQSAFSVGGEISLLIEEKRRLTIMLSLSVQKENEKKQLDFAGKMELDGAVFSVAFHRDPSVSKFTAKWEAPQVTDGKGQQTVSLKNVCQELGVDLDTAPKEANQDLTFFEFDYETQKERIPPDPEKAVKEWVIHRTINIKAMIGKDGQSVDIRYIKG